MSLKCALFLGSFVTCAAIAQPQYDVVDSRVIQLNGIGITEARSLLELFAPVDVTITFAPPEEDIHEAEQTHYHTYDSANVTVRELHGTISLLDLEVTGKKYSLKVDGKTISVGSNLNSLKHFEKTFNELLKARALNGVAGVENLFIRMILPDGTEGIVNITVTNDTICKIGISYDPA